MSKRNTARWFAMLAIALATTALGAAETGAGEDELWFPVGESIVYRIYWGFIPVGESVVTTHWIERDGRRLLVVRIVSRTNKVLTKIYPVDDTLESIIDPETFRPVQFTKNLSEGRYRCHEVTQFDYETLVASMRSFTSGNKKTFEIEPDTRDLISFMYYMRQFELDPDEEIQQRVMADEDVYDVTVEPQGYDRVKLVDGSRRRSLKLEPKAKFDGLFVRKGRGWMWVSDDDDRIVTMIAAQVPVANVKLVLDKVEQLDPLKDADLIKLYTLEELGFTEEEL
jgi:hypothetical protein